MSLPHDDRFVDDTLKFIELLELEEKGGKETREIPPTIVTEPK